MVSRSPLGVSELLKKFQQPQQPNDDYNGFRRDFLSSPSSSSGSSLSAAAALGQHEKGSTAVVSPRRLKWQAALSLRKQKHQTLFHSNSADLEHKDLHYDPLHNYKIVPCLSALNVPRIEDSTPRSRDDNTNDTLETGEVRSDSNISWFGTELIAELDHRILRMHETMANLANETTDLNQQTIALKAKSRELARLRQKHKPLGDEGSDSANKSQNQADTSRTLDNEDDDGDEEDEAPEGLRFVTSSTGDQDIDESTAEQPRHEASSKNVGTDHDTLESLSAEILQLNQNKNQPLSLQYNSTKACNNLNVEGSVGTKQLTLADPCAMEPLPGRRAKSATRLRSSLSSPSSPTFSLSASRPPVSMSSSLASSGRATSSTRLGARRLTWRGEEERVAAY